MDNKITSLQPQAVWKYFNAICQVPRPSGHLDKITEYIMGVGRSLGLDKGSDSFLSPLGLLLRYFNPHFHKGSDNV